MLNVTEEAAIATLPWIGSGKKNAADGAATNKMRQLLNALPINANVAIGEGEMDEAPMLYIGEKLGIGNGPMIDIAVDPIEGTKLVANGQNNAITVLAAAPSGTLLHAPDMYMEKIVVGKKAAGQIDIDAPLVDNLRAIANANGKDLSQLNVFIQKRDRHRKYIDTIRELGGKVNLFDEGDVIYAIAPCISESDIDMFIGVGGAPEGVIASVAVKCLGGEMQAKLLPQNDEERIRCKQMGIEEPDKKLSHDQLINSDDCIFAATAITDNFLFKGIQQNKMGNMITNSLLINGKNKQHHFIRSVYPLN